MCLKVFFCSADFEMLVLESVLWAKLLGGSSLTFVSKPAYEYASVCVFHSPTPSITETFRI